MDTFFIASPQQPMQHPLERGIPWSKANLSSPEDILKQASGADPLRFNILSLPAWLAVAERAGIPFIPAEEIARTHWSNLEATANQTGGDAFDCFEREIVEKLDASSVLRMEQVAPSEIKSQRSSGQPIGNGSFYSSHFGRDIIYLCDDRFYTTFLDLGHEDIIAFRRPRVATRSVHGTHRGEPGSWPIEFRVYVCDSKITGISNYYPQIKLDPGKWAPQARESLQLAEQIIQTMSDLHLGVGNYRLASDMDEPLEHHEDWVPPQWAPQSYTLDFLYDEDAQRMTFLEGGPAGLQAAHPCCFTPRSGRSAAETLSGFAFAEGTPPLNLGYLTD